MVTNDIQMLFFVTEVLLMIKTDRYTVLMMIFFISMKLNVVLPFEVFLGDCCIVLFIVVCE